MAQERKRKTPAKKKPARPSPPKRAAKRAGKATPAKAVKAPKAPRAVQARKRAARAEPPPVPEFERDNQTVESALRTGELSWFLEDYFGPKTYQELRQLTREADTRHSPGGPRVLILPDFMGSKLGFRQKDSLAEDVLWIDPVDVAMGRLDRLALSSRQKVEPLGALLLAYLELKLRLRSARYEVDFFAYDWRRSIADLGRELVARLARERGPVNLVAHGMGGLVARWALAHGADCQRLVMLGTPNYGTFLPVQVLRGVHPVVRRLGEIDREHDAEWLAHNVFATFPSLTQMLPSPDHFGEVNLYNLSQWPAGDDLRPRREILDRVRDVQKGLARADERFFVIAGVNQKTLTGLRRAPEGFAYEFSYEGDGLVPVTLAHLPGARTWYVQDSHGLLPTNSLVARAIEEILDKGTTQALPDGVPATAQHEPPQVCFELDLKKNPYGAARDGALSLRERRHLLEEVVAPQARQSALTVEAPAQRLSAETILHPGNRFSINQTRKHRLDVRLAHGSITEADTRAIALGIFRDVAPSGPARALDERLGGTITELFRRRMFSGEVGEIFMMPTGRYPVAADHVAFVGLGSFDRFNVEVLQTAAENVIRTFINTRVEEFSTVLLGVGSGESASIVLQNLLAGFLRGLCDADRSHFFHRVVICEKDRERFQAAKEELVRFWTNGLYPDVELVLDEVVLPAPSPPPEIRSGPERKDPIYLIVRREGENDTRNGFQVRSSLLTAGSKAGVVTGLQTVTEQSVQDCIAAVSQNKKMDLSKVGTELARHLLTDAVRTVLLRHRDRHMVVVHDAFLSRVPWEVLALRADPQSSPGALTLPSGPEIWFPAAEEGLSHRYAADNLSVAKWLERRVQDKTLNVLLVLNPTEDLEGAEREGEVLQRLLASLPSIEVEVIARSEATRPALLSAFGSGEYDVIHYAGHAEFDPMSPEQSGILCHNEARLTGADLAGVGNLPTLVFFNACESARVRQRTRKAVRPRGRRRRGELRDRITDAMGLAEAFLRGGIANFVGTYWPVGDREAEIFSLAFYEQILHGRPLGRALQVGREAIRKEQGTKDWANYILYGNPDFVLKEGGTQGM